MGDVGGVQRGLRGWRASVGDVPAWVMWVVYVYVFVCFISIWRNIALYRHIF